MFGRSRRLIVIPTIILITILLGMVPLNCIQKIGSGCPITQGKQMLRCSPCPSNSLNPPNDPIFVSLNPTALEQEPVPSFYYRPFDSNVILSNSLEPLHLRC
jgi:hypothetical protein